MNIIKYIVLLLSEEGYNIASVLCPIPFSCKWNKICLNQSEVDLKSGKKWKESFEGQNLSRYAEPRVRRQIWPDPDN